SVKRGGPRSSGQRFPNTPLADGLGVAGGLWPWATTLLRMRDMAPRAFYCVADSRFFIGAVAVINSLRLVGHSEPIYMLDGGLTRGRRDLLAGEVDIVEPGRRLPPHMLKTAAPLACPAESMLLIDTDVIVTRSLASLFEITEAGKIAAFE